MDLFDSLPPLFIDARSLDQNSLYAGRYPMLAHFSGQGHVIKVPDGELWYVPHFFSQAISDRIMQALIAFEHCEGDDNKNTPYQNTHSQITSWHSEQWQHLTNINAIEWQNIAWRQDHIKIYGKTIPLPRLSAWYGDPDCAYSYSGIYLQPNPWNNVLNWIRNQLRVRGGFCFNSALLNWYRSGRDHMSWHADDEPVLGRNPRIASVNFGASRRFLLRRIDDHQQKIEIPLHHGSLLVMSGALQHYWQHCVPKQARVQHSRINMTFRTIVT